MRVQKLYRDIVIIGAAMLLFVYVKGRFDLWQMEQKPYGVLIQSQSELTGAVVSEFANFLGIRQFLPFSSTEVTLKLGESSMETELKGIYLDEYPLRWVDVDEGVRLGNTAVLFLGAGSFSAFVDKNGRAPANRQVQEWIDGYTKLQITVVDEAGKERQAKVFGILKEPEGIVCMDKGQMEQVFGPVCRVRGGYLKVHGYRNMQAAKEALLGAGFSVEDIPFIE